MTDISVFRANFKFYLDIFFKLKVKSKLKGLIKTTFIPFYIGYDCTDTELTYTAVLVSRM